MRKASDVLRSPRQAFLPVPHLEPQPPTSPIPFHSIYLPHPIHTHVTPPPQKKMTENGPADAPTGSTSDPSGFLSEIIGSPITVKLNSGVEYRGSLVRIALLLLLLLLLMVTIGELSSVDGYMNIALEKTVEYVNGEVRNKYGDVFIRGNNGMLLFFFLRFSDELGWANGLLVLYISQDAV